MATELFGQRFEGAVAGTICSALNAAGSGLIEASVPLFMVPGFQVAAAKTGGVGALLLLAEQLGCTYDRGGKSPTGGTYCGLDMSKVCLDVEVGDHRLQYEYPDGDGIIQQYSRLTSIGCAYSESDYPDRFGYYSHYREVVTDDGTGSEPRVTQDIFRSPTANPDSVILYSIPIDVDDKPSECSKRPRVEPFEGLDGNNCEFTAQLVGMGQGTDGNVGGLILLEGGHHKQKWEDEEMWNRPEPGLINDDQPFAYNQECNISPMLIWGDMNNEYNYTPINPGEDWQEALDRMRNALGNKIDSGVDDITGDLDEIKDLIENLPDLGAPISIPSGTVTFQAVCDKDDQGNLEQVQYQLGGATTTNEALVQIYSNQTKLFAMIQQHLNWKTPICEPEPVPLEGAMRTISFRSDETSPYGKSRLRKRLRYRSSSGIGLGALVDHWRLFQWNAGPVRVIHTGSSSGTLTVWAADEREGQRVIRHALAEAGIDPDQVGRWEARSSDYARLGVPGEMKVDTTGGYYWITERDGSNNRPIVAQT